MAHFAKLGPSNTVTQVVVVSNKDTSDADGIEREHIGQAFLENLLGGTWVQTSYNNNFRIRYAGTGYEYRPDLNTSNVITGAFIPPKPYESWTLNTEYTFNWDPPVPQPETPQYHVHIWVEDNYQSNANGWYLANVLASL
tara:strand:- start:434 stop:853 length:420 start_codon:yes stop_codon:yes gene_type:complete